MWIRADAGPECRTWLKADAGGRFCVLLTCEARQGLRQDSSEYGDYEKALDLLLERLKKMRAVVDHATACAARGPQSRQGANNIKHGPIDLATVNSIVCLRREILTLKDLAEFPISKRCESNLGPINEHTELYVYVMGYGSSSLDRLAVDLQELSARENERVAYLDPGSTSEIHVPSGSPVSGLEVPDIFQGDLERKVWIRARQEQTALRNLLARQRNNFTCALCGHRYPLEFLAAAHIKKRSACNETERRDLTNVAMLACTFGCDCLYEAGWITVDGSGSIKVADSVMVEAGPLEKYLVALEGRQCAAHTVISEPYFSWHRSTIFLG